MNIGTCITALLAAVGTSRNAKRTTVIHISFNVIGTILFTTLCLTTPLISMIEGWTPSNASAQIANLHTFFNIVTSILLIPFGTWLTKLAEVLLREKGNARQEQEGYYLLNIKPINSDRLGVSAISMDGTRKELMRMLEMVRENVHNAFEVFASKNTASLTQVEQKEDYIDYLNKEISKYITTAMIHETTENGSRIFNAFYSLTSNIERMGDHAMNIAGYSKMITEKNIVFSEMAQKEIGELQKVCDKMFYQLFEKDDDMISWHARIAGMEQRIDDMTDEYRNNMFARIQQGTCSDEGSILFSEMLTDFEIRLSQSHWL